MPSLAFRIACWKPLFWARRFSLTAIPAASSAADWMRRPDESLPMAPCIIRAVFITLVWAEIEPTLVMIASGVDIVSSPFLWLVAGSSARHVSLCKLKTLTGRRLVSSGPSSSVPLSGLQACQRERSVGT